MGHKFRGSAPLAYRRLHRVAEPLGWWQVLVCFVISAYYAVIIAWSLMYTIFSFTEAWGDDAEGYFFGTFLNVADAPGISFNYVPSVFFPLLLIWIAVIIIMVAGIRKGISRANSILLPLLVVMFVLLVIQSLFLPGAAEGLNAFFTPDWSALADPSVWAAAYGHIFFSLSVGYGIMVTYSSYLKRRTDLTGSGMVVAFSNSGFEILAGIGVFAALGFMAQASGAGVNDVVTQGIGLAFVAFPTIVSQVPFGAFIGVLFFGSLVFAGVTSLISVLEVIVAAVQDKLGWGRVRASLVVSVLVAAVSLGFFPTATGLYILDTSDAFVNSFGITLGALVTVVVLAWFLRKLPLLSSHLNRISTIKMRRAWMGLVAGVVPLALVYMVSSEFISKISTTYEGYPDWFVGLFGWGMSGALVILALVLTFIPWSRKSKAHDDPEYDSLVAKEAKEESL